MAIWHRNGGCILRFDDTVTLYNKTTASTGAETWTRTVVHGVQWADHYDKENNGGKINVARYASVTFPEGTYEGLILNPKNEEDALVYGEVSDVVTSAKGSRISDLLQRYQKAGQIKVVNDNSNRALLKNIKVVVS